MAVTDGTGGSFGTKLPFVRQMTLPNYQFQWLLARQWQLVRLTSNLAGWLEANRSSLQLGHSSLLGSSTDGFCILVEECFHISFQIHALHAWKT